MNDKRFNSNIDLQNNTLKNFKIQGFAVAPSADDYLIYFDTAIQSIGIYNGSIWVYQDAPLNKSANTVWIDGTLADNRPNSRVFMTYGDAILWLNLNGSVSAINPWNVILSGGALGTITAYDYINVSCIGGVTVTNLISKVSFSSTSSFYKCFISNLQITNLDASADGNCLLLSNCVIGDVENPVIGSEFHLGLFDCVLKGSGSFERIEGNTELVGYKYTSFTGTYTEISGYLDFCHLSGSCSVGSVTFRNGSLPLTTTTSGNVINSLLTNLTASITLLSGSPNTTLRLSHVTTAYDADLILTVPTTKVLETDLVTGISVVLIGGSWLNKGHVFNNSGTSLSATNSEAALREIASLIAPSITLVIANTHTLLSTDRILHIAVVADVCEITVPTSQIVDNREFTVKDALRQCQTYNITLVGEGGELIGGLATYTIDKNNSSITFYVYDGELFVK